MKGHTIILCTGILFLLVFSGMNLLPLPSGELQTSSVSNMADTSGAVAEPGIATRGNNWYIRVIDDQGDVGMYSSIALDSSDTPHISYLNDSGRDLKYATISQWGWMNTTLDFGNVEGYSSITLDSGDQPHVSYHNDGNLKYVYLSQGGGWTYETVDYGGSLGNHSSIALDNNDDPHISYFDHGQKYLRYARYESGLSRWWIRTIDTGNYLGEYTSIEIEDTAHQFAHISYYDRMNGYLKYSKNQTGGWNTSVVDGVGYSVGRYTSLELDSRDQPHITYFNESNSKIKYTNFDGSQWSFQNPDQQPQAGQFTSLALDSRNHLHLSYYDYSNDDLKYAYYDGNGWQQEIVDSPGNVGLFTSIAVDSHDIPHISYYDLTNGVLKYATIDNVLPTVEDTTQGDPTTGDQFLVQATVQDNIEMDRVHLVWSHDQVGDNITMHRRGNTWDANILLSNSTQPLVYTIKARDRAGNWNVTTEYQMEVTDNDDPEVFDGSPREGFTGDGYNFSMIVRDNVGLREVYVQWEQEGPEKRANMTPGADDLWEGSIILDGGSLTMDYTIFIVDHKGSLYQTAPIEVTVHDNDPPELYDVTADELPGTDGNCTLHAAIRDNVGVSTASMKYHFLDPAGTEMAWKESEMSRQSGDEWIAGFYVPPDAAIMKLFFLAYDEYGNELNTDIHPDIGLITVNVTDTIPPAVDAGGDMTMPEDTDVEFDGTGSSDNIGIINWTWFVDLGDGSEIYLYDEVSSFTFTDVGQYEVSLNATDGAGNDAEDSFTLHVTDATAPVAEAGDNITINQGETARFDGHGSYDNVGIVKWTWTFMYEGVEITLDGPEPEFGFEVPGTYDVTLTLKDETGLGSEDHVVVIVLDTEKPFLSVKVNDMNIDQDAELEVDAGSTVSFSAEGSTDNVDITEYEWVGSGPGDFEIRLVGIAQQYNFDTEGKFSVTLFVRDAAGNEEQLGFVINVVTSSGPVEGKVTARIFIEDTEVSHEGTYQIKVGTALTLDGTHSESRNGDIEGYQWLIRSPGGGEDNDGGDIWGFTFNEEGTYDVELTVSDDEGMTGTITISIRSSQEGAVGLTVGPVLDVDGTPVVGATISFIHDGTRYEAETDSEGMAVFRGYTDGDIPMGTKIKADKDGETMEWKRGETPPRLGTSGGDEEGVPPAIMGAIAIVGIVVIIILLILIVKKKKRRKAAEAEISVLEAELRTMGRGEKETGRVAPEDVESESGEEDDERGDDGAVKGKEIPGKQARKKDGKRGKAPAHEESVTKEAPPEPEDDYEEEEDEDDAEDWDADEEAAEEWDDAESDDELELPPPPEDLKEHLPSLELEKVSSAIKNIIPGYIITDKLGAGGFATVYKAINRDGISVAIKMPKFLDETIDSSILNKFQAEADIWKKLKHKNIVTFLDSDIRPVPYMTIELMEGGNLGGLLKDHRLSVREAKPLMLGILDGLSYAHRMASVHRDIKPENILFTKDGVPKIGDWGIGKFMASESVSQSIGTKGTFLYSAPEQFDKQTYGAVDWSTDIFQIGVVFYEMLTGINPFKADELAAVMGRILTVNPEPPSSIDPDIPAEIDEIVMKCLEKQKEDRWRSTDVLYSKLRDVEKRKQGNLKKYRHSLERALEDGKISRDEENMLGELREHMGITDDEHAALIAELQGDDFSIEV